MSFLPAFCTKRDGVVCSPILPFILVGTVSPLIDLIPDSISIAGYAIIGLVVLGVGTGINYLFDALGGTAESPSLLPPIASASRYKAEVEEVVPDIQPEPVEALGYNLDFMDWLAEEQPTVAA